MIHFVTTFITTPLRVVLQQFDVKPVEATGRPDVEGAFTDLLNRGDASQRQKEAKVIREIRKRTGDGLASLNVFGLKIRAISRYDETNLALGCGWTVFQGLEGIGNAARMRDRNVQVVRLKYTANVRLV